MPRIPFRALTKASLAWVRPRSTPVSIWPGLSGKNQYAKQTGRRRHLLASWVCLNGAGSPLGCVTHQLLFKLGLFEWRLKPFGMCNASATFQLAIARALQKIVNREGSLVMAYIDDIVIATETVEDHMVRLREVFECLREADFKISVAKCDFMKSEIKYLGRVVSAEGIKPNPKAASKLRDWEVPRNKSELQSFLGFANNYREFIPWHAKLVAPLHAITGLGATVAWGVSSNRLSMPSSWL